MPELQSQGEFQLGLGTQGALSNHSLAPGGHYKSDIEGAAGVRGTVHRKKGSQDWEGQETLTMCGPSAYGPGGVHTAMGKT